MSDPVFTPDYTQNLPYNFTDDANLVGQSDLFADVAGASPRVDYSDDRVGEAPTAGIASLPDYSGFGLEDASSPSSTPPATSTPASADIEDSVILGQDFGQQDIFGYDFLDPLNPSYRFLTPSQLGNPEGIETMFDPVERDPFRADWADGDFRSIAGYEGDLLSAEDMMRVQDAQNFLSNIELNARAGGWSTTEDYLRSIEQSDQSTYDQLVADFNTNAGIWDTYGDTYQFQASYDRLQATEGEEAPDPSELTNAAGDLLEAFVNQGIITAPEAAGILSDDRALVDWYSNILQYEGVGDLTPTPSSSIDPDELFYYSDDTDEERPYVRDASGNFVPYLAEGEELVDGRVIRTEGNRITVVRDQYDYSGGGTGGGTSTGTGGTTSGTTSGDPDIEYASWDENEEHPFVYDEVSESFVPALRGGERRVTTSEGAEIVNEDGDVIREEHSDWREAPSTGIRGIQDDGITAEDVPVTSEGVYDLAQDIARSPEDVVNSYLGEDATLDLAQEFQIGWDRSNPVDDPAIFSSEVDLFPGQNLPTVERQVGTETVGRTWRVGSGRVVPVMQTFYVGDLSLVNSINYEPSSIVTVSGTELGGPDKDWQHEQIRDLVPDLEGRSARPPRVIGAGWNDWDFDMFGNQEVQELLFTELVNYSDITGVSLDSIYNTEHGDIGSYDSENPDALFDSEHFMQGDEDSGWGGFSDILQDFVEDNAIGSVGSNEDHLSQRNLEKFALFSTFVLRPMMLRLEGISDSRQRGIPFDENVSIPSEYSSQYGAYSPPDYLREGLNLAGPLDEGPGVIPGTGGFAGGIVNAMAGGGYIGGAEGGMDDTIPASIDGSNAAALSSGEFVVPADVVSHLGDGNNQNGASKLYQLLDQVRTVKTGSVEQPAPLNDGIMSGIMGDSYGR